MVHAATDIQNNFQTLKKLSCQFYVSSIGEAFIFLRDVCKLQSVVNFECDFFLVPNEADVQYNFQTKQKWVVNFMSVLLVKHLFF